VEHFESCSKPGKSHLIIVELALSREMMLLVLLKGKIFIVTTQGSEAVVAEQIPRQPPTIVSNACTSRQGWQLDILDNN